MFTSHHGAVLDAGNVWKMFKRICTEAGAGAGDGWTPRDLRTTFVSLMSHQGAAIEEIVRLVGHATTRTTETVYRRELRPRHHRRRRDHGPALHRNLAPRESASRRLSCTSQPLIPESSDQNSLSSPGRQAIQ